MRSARLLIAVLMAAVCVPRGSSAADADMNSPIKSDESVTLFASTAWPSRETAGAWDLEIRGVIFEEESRPFIAAGITLALSLKTENLTELERATLKERLGLFLVDNERGKALPVLVGTEEHVLSPSGSNGHFSGTVTLPGDVVEGVLQHGRIPLLAVTRAGDERKFAGFLCVLPDNPEPLVISDIDDTIKVTSVRDFEEAKMNTFCRPFLPVEGMAGVYQAWAETGAGFYYVTGSPWQLYRPLEAFREEFGFPAGGWQMKHIRLADPQTIRAFAAPQNAFKLQSIELLLERWTHRPVVLVGDSGEQDPEIYGTIARKYPGRVSRIFIREVSGDTREGKRYAAAFEGIEGVKWQLFHTGADLPRRLD